MIVLRFLSVFVIQQMVSPRRQITIYILFSNARRGTILFTMNYHRRDVSGDNGLSMVKSVNDLRLQYIFTRSSVFPRHESLVLGVYGFATMFVQSILINIT